MHFFLGMFCLIIMEMDNFFDPRVSHISFTLGFVVVLALEDTFAISPPYSC